jgi:ornithine cyclodeaminase
MKILDAETTRSALPFTPLIAALERMFAVGCDVPSRQVYTIGAMTSLVMPAWQRDRYYGVKVVNVAPSNATRDLPALHATYLLFDATTGVPLALMDGDVITARRTAAASALAASRLARADAAHLLIVGAGRVAELLAEAYATVRPIQSVSVWARDPAKADALVRRLQRSGRVAHAVASMEDAVRAADIVSCATLASSPVVQGRWLARGSHLDLIGSFTPAMREADDDCFAGARLYVDTLEALEKSGDLLGPLQRGVISPSDVRGTLDELCRHPFAPARSSTDRSVFKSVGTALEDLAAAILAYEGHRSSYGS